MKVLEQEPEIKEKDIVLVLETEKEKLLIWNLLNYAGDHGTSIHGNITQEEMHESRYIFWLELDRLLKKQSIDRLDKY